MRCSSLKVRVRNTSKGARSRRYTGWVRIVGCKRALGIKVVSISSKKLCEEAVSGSVKHSPVLRLVGRGVGLWWWHAVRAVIGHNAGLVLNRVGLGPFLLGTQLGKETGSAGEHTERFLLFGRGRLGGRVCATLGAGVEVAEEGGGGGGAGSRRRREVGVE